MTAQPDVASPSADPTRLDPAIALAVTAFFASLVTLLMVLALPAPYVVMSAGPAINTLGNLPADNAPIITIKGRETYPTGSGTLDLTTVRLAGGPGSRLNAVDAIWGWLDPTRVTVNYENLYDKRDSAESTNKESEIEMLTSQESAKAAALRSLHITVPESVKVADFTAADSPAALVLKVDDVISSVNGIPLKSSGDLAAELQKVIPGTAARLSIIRNGSDLEVQVPVKQITVKDEYGQTTSRHVIGVYVIPQYTFPFEIRFDLQSIGGPSAGTMLALAIVDKLTPGEMTAGKKFAGTGTITGAGVVGPIGGIQQKLVGAKAEGAQYFLAPAANCNEVVGHIPDGLRVIKITTLADARQSVESIAAGKDPAALPQCG